MRELLRFPFGISALAVLMFVGCGGSNGSPKLQAELWSETERKAVVSYWSVEGRYKVEPVAETPERVNITVPGSTWYWTYNRATPTDKTVAAQWDEWVKKRVAADRAVIAKAAEIPDPGPIPEDLKASVGVPPPLYEIVHPLRYTVAFAKEDAPSPFVYTDNIPFADRKNFITFYRSTNGVIRAGKKVKDYTGDEKKQLEALYASVGRTESERHVVQAVSALEGGFEAINTYDTGFVSIGFIQFITAKDGHGSLSAVLARHKQADPADFADTFRRFGIDVAPDGTVATVDPTTGNIMTGADAVKNLINDKRLTAVFERAGGRDAFRRAQIAIALERYWPGDDLVTVTVNNAPQTAKVSDLIHSEAGFATLMDRKVNRGNIRPINDVATALMQEKKLTAITDLAKYEREIVTAMKYRHDYLSDSTLSQPAGAAPAAPASGTANRSGGAKGTRGSSRAAR